uniref:Glycosyltransferase 2-like domain-containing protein n=1 Tax=Ananas comosus var. bracteatus TaxID=296719 RepID=A0A6V7QRI9_ANACO
MSSALTVNPLSPAKVKSLHPHPTPPPLFSLLPQCTAISELKQLHALAIKSQLHHHPSFLTRFITHLTRRPDPSLLRYARHLFDRIPQPNLILYNAMSRGYSRSDDPFRYLPFHCHGLRWRPAAEEGRQAHAFAVKCGVVDNIYVRPTLINMYAECGDLRAARVLFDGMDDQCVVSYNSMITASVRSSRPSAALALFREMQAKGIKPTDVTLLSVLSACTLLGALELGKWIHEYVKKNGFDSYVKVNTALIDMYAKCGSLEDAIHVFQGMSSRDTQAWSAMIVAYAIHGHGSKAISMFDEMKREGIKPDDITFLGVLYACSHAGMVDEGLCFFNSMNKHGLIPGIKHYGCVIDLLARSGQLKKAYKFVDNLPVKPTPILWRTLLSACGGHGEVDIGKKVFERILELDDSHGGDYVIFSNMCVNGGWWEEVNRIRKIMGERGVVKVPGCSSIEVDSTVHEFFSGDGMHPQSREARKMVDEMMEQLKLVGYRPTLRRFFTSTWERKRRKLALANVESLYVEKPGSRAVLGAFDRWTAVSGLSPEQVYGVWLRVRARAIAPVLRAVVALCMVMSVMLVVEAAYMSLVSLAVKLLRLRPEKKWKWEQITMDGGDLEGRGSNHPMVLIQIPMYNEIEVYKLSIGAACALTWPQDRIIIQVLDDSTDPTIKDLVELECQTWARKGINIKYVIRSDRKGFKAGALKRGMDCDYAQKCDFVAIFDADFQPESDFLMRTIPFFVFNPEIALVQARWDFGKNPFTI